MSTQELTGEWRSLGRPVDGSGYRFDAYLAENFPFLSRNGWQKRIDDGQVWVAGDEGRTTLNMKRSSYRLRCGDQIYMFQPQSAEPDVDTTMELLWHDGPVMVVAKPSGLPMHENGKFRKNTVAHVLTELFGKEWSAVHRLDKETSGIVICGAAPDIRLDLAKQLAQRKVQKEYLAIARGIPSEDYWTVDQPIGEPIESAIRIKKWVDPKGLPSLTRFETIDKKRDYSLLKAKPVTGRTNQIRIHAAHAGHVLVGDKMYHPDEGIFLDYYAGGNTESVVARAGFARVCLHAHRIVFRHPEHGGEVDVTSAMAADMQGLWDSLDPE